MISGDQGPCKKIITYTVTAQQKTKDNKDRDHLKGLDPPLQKKDKRKSPNNKKEENSKNKTTNQKETKNEPKKGEKDIQRYP